MLQTTLFQASKAMPNLLEAVHNLMETQRIPQRFVLTGSSAGKLKAGGGTYWREGFPAPEVPCDRHPV